MTRHTAHNQERWNEFSQETVSTLSTLLAERKRPSAREIMQFLGGRRQAIAQEAKYERYLEMGALRSSVPLSRRSESDGFAPIDPFYHQIMESLSPYLNTNTDDILINKEGPLLQFDDYFEYRADKNNTTCFKFTGTIGKGVDVLYPKVSKGSDDQFFEMLDGYLGKLLAWRVEDGKKAFIDQLAALAYDCYRYLPFQLGTAAITNWLVRGIAESKGIEIGAENKNSGLPLDLKAFFTFDKQTYADWFSNMAFEKIGLKNEMVANVTSLPISTAIANFGISSTITPAEKKDNPAAPSTDFKPALS